MGIVCLLCAGSLFTAVVNGGEEGSGCAPLFSSMDLLPLSGNEEHFLCEWDEDFSHSIAMVRFGEAPPKPTRRVAFVAPP